MSNECFRIIYKTVKLIYLIHLIGESFTVPIERRDVLKILLFMTQQHDDFSNIRFIKILVISFK